jgi:hypothetical protein
VIDVIAMRGANIDSDHMLVVIKLRARICRASNTKPQQLRRFAVNRLKDRDVASWYYDELDSERQGQPLKNKLTNGTTILERGLPIYGLRPNHVCEVIR